MTATDQAPPKRPSMRGAVVVITGAGSGIGAAASQRFADAGAHVVCVDIEETAAAAVAQQIEEAGGRAEGRGCDVADYDAVAELAAKIEADVGPVDTLVNNAGVFMASAFLDQTIEDWRWIRSINLDGVVNGCMAFGPSMTARRYGQVVNIASAAAWTPVGVGTGYATTKAAVLMFSESLRLDWAKHRVGVSCLCPGAFNTGIQQRGRVLGDFGRHTAVMDRLARISGDPEQVAKAIVRASRSNPSVVAVGLDGKLIRSYRQLVPAPIQQRLAGLLPG